MRIFLSAGEPSGDLHGANLARCLQQLDPSVDLTGFGGAKMAAAGVQLQYPLCDLAVMWFGQAIANLRTFFRILKQADDDFRDHRPDAVVMIDYPGFHFKLAQRAAARGIPVYWFVPPQLWAWAPWRVKKVRRWVSHVLCTLPFEKDWYAQRGVTAEFIGHPYFDELPAQQLDPTFTSPGGRVVALLPGSRRREVELNWSTLAETARLLHESHPDTRFLVACFNEEQAELVRAALPSGVPVELHVGRTPDVIAAATACVAVSGSVSLELLWRRKPTVVVYRLKSKFHVRVGRAFMRVPHISLVNLLAGQEVFPEYLTHRNEAPAVAGHLRRWFDEPAALQAVTAQLATLTDRIAAPGACRRAAESILTARLSVKAA